MMINKEPKMDWIDLLGAGLIYLGLLLFLVSLHILAINSGGDTANVLTTIFTVFLSIYVGTVILGFAGIVIQLLRWATWQVNTPVWKKEQIKKNRVGKE